MGYIAPVHDLLSHRQELVREQQTLEVMKQQRRSLQAQLRALQRDDVIERRARALGAAKPGERTFIVEEPAGDGTSPARPPG